MTRIEGSFMVATLPLAARRMCFFPSCLWSDALNGVEVGCSLVGIPLVDMAP